MTRTPRGPRHPVNWVNPDVVSKADFVEAMSKKEDAHLRELLKEKDTALQVAKEEMSRRLDGMNHLQAQIKEQSDTFVRKDFYDTQHNTLVDRVDFIREVQLKKADIAFAMDIKKTIDDHIKTQEGKEAANIKFTWGFTLVGPAVGALIAWLLMHK